MERTDLKKALDDLYARYEDRRFVDPDPLVFLYDYEKVRDREVAGFIASALAFGGVRQIMSSIEKVLGLMGGAPHEFLLAHDRKEMGRIFAGFRHRWASGIELSALLAGLRSVIDEYGSLESAFLSAANKDDEDVLPGLTGLADDLYERSPGRIDCLVPSPRRGSACKRLNLFLRWMVREDGIDPGGWKGVDTSSLLIPLDVHMHRFAGFLGLTSRTQGDMRTVREVTRGLSVFDPEDPVRYDFAITRLGIRRDDDRESLLSSLGLVVGDKGLVAPASGSDSRRSGRIER